MSTKLSHISLVFCTLLSLVLTFSLVLAGPIESSRLSENQPGTGSRSVEYSSGSSLNANPSDGFGNILTDYLEPKSSSSNENNRNNYYYPPLVNSLQRPSYRWTALPAEDLLNAFQNDRLVFLRMPARARNPLSRKRSCLINAGMTNNCDFKDYISATSARRMWESPSGPGKRSQPNPATNLNGFRTSDDAASPSWSGSVSRVLAQDSHRPIAIDQQSDLSSSKLIEFHQSQPEPQPQSQIRQLFGSSANKRMECLSGLPGGDCENTFLGSESMGQDFLRPGGRNPGRR